MVHVHFSKSDVISFQPWIDVDEISFADRFWPSEENDVTKYETRRSFAPPQLPSWKSTSRSYAAVGGPIWMKRDVPTQNYMTMTTIRSKWKPKKKQWTEKANNWRKNCWLIVLAHSPEFYSYIRACVLAGVEQEYNRLNCGTGILCTQLAPPEKCPAAFAYNYKVDIVENCKYKCN